MTTSVDKASTSRHPLTPSLWRVVGRRRETVDVTTLMLSPERGPAPAFQHGQFHMLTAFGVGEAAVSIAGTAGAPGSSVEHSIRDVGPVTHAFCQLPVGGIVGVRGPYGRGWDIAEDPKSDTAGTDYVVMAGGIGLAPLRGAVQELANRHRDGARLFVLVGARSPDQILFERDLESWRRSGAYVDVSVDTAPTSWSGTVGVVTALLPTAPFDPSRTVALLCGPEIMMRFAAAALVDRGVDPARIQVSLERNMQCGCGLCGHCQLGPLLLCRDGPVVPYGGPVAELLRERQR